MILNLIFLKYATANEMLNLLKPFLGEGATASVYEPANLLIIQDNARSMRRTMDLIWRCSTASSSPDSVCACSRSATRRPTDLQKELDRSSRPTRFPRKASRSSFIPVDRINTLIAVAPNPGHFRRR